MSFLDIYNYMFNKRSEINNKHYCKVELHIGEIIKQRVEELGMSKAEFSRRINTTSQNIYGIFKKNQLIHFY